MNKKFFHSQFAVLFRAFSYRNYRLFFFGQSISLIGTWMQNVGMGWLVYRMTQSAFLLGMVSFLSQIPVFFLAPFAGVLADRKRRKNILIVTQVLSMIQASVLAFLVMSHRIAVPHILLLSVFLGIVNAFDVPARQAFVFELISDKNDFSNAIALNSLMFNLARFMGPLIAGMLIALWGEGVCFLMNGISYYAVLWALGQMVVVSRETPLQKQHPLQELREGFSYVWHFPQIRSLLSLVSLISLVGVPYAVLMPIFTREILHGGPRTLGLLMSGVGIGALCGAIYLASCRDLIRFGRNIIYAAFIFGFGVFLLSFMKTTVLSVFVLAAVGFGIMVCLASSNTLLQTLVDDDKRGRVMSFYALAFVGTAPLGSFVIGSVASSLGIAHTLMLGGFFSMTVAILFSKKISSISAVRLSPEKEFVPQDLPAEALFTDAG